MKIDYDNIEATKPHWKVGDVIRDTNGFFYLVSEVTINYEIFYTLIELEDGVSIGHANNIGELQQACHDSGDMILDGTFKYINDDLNAGISEVDEELKEKNNEI